MAEVVIEVRDLKKVYRPRNGGEVRAVDGVSFEVYRGETFGFLGPNGAGKTTTLEILEGLRKPTSGTARVLGYDVARSPNRVKERIGVQLQEASYFKELSLVEILRLLGSYYPRSADPVELLAAVGLGEKAKARYRELSGGQARRFSLAAALVNDPSIVFLDEPTTGLDPRARRSVWELIERLKSSDERTVILTTHYMEEAERLADRVAIVDRGKLRACDTPARLVSNLGGAYTATVATSGLRRDDLAFIADQCDARVTYWRTSEETEDGALQLELTCSSPPVVARFVQQVAAAGGKVRDLKVRGTTLEDVFLSLTGHALSD